jgi:hypothetical protein
MLGCVCSLCVPFLAACQSYQTGAPQARGRAEAVAYRHPSLEDFPIPAGFGLVDEHSMSADYGSIRMVQYEFTGGAQRDWVARFYVDKLPSYGWTLRGRQFDHGVYNMRFDSSREECLLKVSRSGRRTLINVKIGPRPRGSVDHELKPPPASRS